MIPLTIRSSYSLMWGTSHVKQVCRQAKRLGYDRLALTDTDNLYGLWPFLAACKREGLSPIVGAEVTQPGSRKRAVCLVEDETGYRNLCRLLTRRHMDGDFDLETVLPNHAPGLVVLTQNPDLLRTWHLAGITVAAAMPRTPLPPTHQLRRAAKYLGVPLVATPGSFFFYTRRMGSSTGCCVPLTAIPHFHAWQPTMSHRRMPGWLHRPNTPDGLPSVPRPLTPPMKLPNAWCSAVPNSALSCRRWQTATATIRTVACAPLPTPVLTVATETSFPKGWSNGSSTNCAALRAWGSRPIF